jgi:hypothetical protein
MKISKTEYAVMDQNQKKMSDLKWNASFIYKEVATGNPAIFLCAILRFLKKNHFFWLRNFTMSIFIKIREDRVAK